MKTKNFYYSLSLILFILLFYNQFIGINLSILALFLLSTSYFLQSSQIKSRSYFLALSGGVLGALSFAYYGDFTSFLVVFISLNWVAMLMFDPQQKLIKLLVLGPINLLMVLPNGFSTKPKLKESKLRQNSKKIVAYAIVPLSITFIFALLYIASSDLVSDFFSHLSFNLNIKFHLFLWVAFLGSILMYAFWYFSIPKTWGMLKADLKDDFTASHFAENPYADMIRKSAEITFIMLNITLFIFIVIYGIENFSLEEQGSALTVSVHKRINAVIFSIVMAISLILYFFRGHFNFDPKNNNLKRLSFAWMGLNSVLVSIAFVKNIEYVYALGLTEKRIGVFIFLILCWIGLYLTYKKVSLRKTNWYLLHRMGTVVYITTIILSVFNWGWIITKFNIETNIPIEKYPYYYKNQLNGNDVLLYDYFKSKNNTKEMKDIKYLNALNKVEFELDGDLQSLYKQYVLDNKD